MAQKRSQITQPSTRSRLATSTTSSWRDRDHSAIHHQLGASDKAAVIGGQEDYSLGDLVGLTHPPERDLCRHLRSELRDLLFVAQALISLSWHHAGADGVDANFTLLQIAGPGAGKGTNRCFRRAVNAEGFHANRGDDRGIQDDHSPILKQRKRFLDGKEQALDLTLMTLNRCLTGLRCELRSVPRILIDLVNTLNGGVGTTYKNPKVLLICPP